MTKEQQWLCIVEISVTRVREWAERRKFFEIVDELDSILRVVTRGIEGKEEVKTEKITKMIDEICKRNSQRLQKMIGEEQKRAGIEIVEDCFPGEEVL